MTGLRFLIRSHRYFAFPTRFRQAVPLLGYAAALLVFSGRAAAQDAATIFAEQIRPILANNCYSCHADGGDSGGIAFDKLDEQHNLLGNRAVWERVLKNVRSGIMPPPDEPKLTPADRERLVEWIKRQAFGLDPKQPDPGRVTLRRMNRVEYRNTIRDLLGVDYKVDEQFPPDDSGHGFDNIADVLTVSPMLLEKYMAAADTVVSTAVPITPKAPANTYLAGASFKADASPGDNGPIVLSYYEPATVRRTVTLPKAGAYGVTLNLYVQGRWAEKGFDYNRSDIRVTLDGEELLHKDYGWAGGQKFVYEFPRTMTAGDHEFVLDLKPTTAFKERLGELKMQLSSITLQGPMDEKDWITPPNHDRYFGQSPIPTDAAGRRTLAGRILSDFAARAFRRPIDAATRDRLVSLAESIYTTPGHTFEAGVAHAMKAVLASPRFLFLQDTVDAKNASDRYPLIDEYSLASRLSYFLWSSTPDAELYRLAAAGQLRQQLRGQVARMLADGRASAFFENFPGQWLQARDVEQVPIERNRILSRQEIVDFVLKKDEDYGAMRASMRRETVDYFGHIVRNNRSLLELVDSNYTFLNERLARHYQIPGVTGDQMRRVELPPDSPRGGVLTMGTVLMVTSNPTRTSPVKRGLFLLENVLGSPPPPPPPNIPSLEAAGKTLKDKHPTLRQTLELHRSDPTCFSCHSRMDPPGLALENFNALGVWRDRENGQPIDPTGTLITGEKFKDIRELKRILVRDHAEDIYRCVTEKLLTYAIGRGIEYYDVETIDGLVAGLNRDNGKFMTLLTGIIESAPFQRARTDTELAGTSAGAATPSQQSSN